MRRRPGTLENAESIRREVKGVIRSDGQERGRLARPNGTRRGGAPERVER